MSNFKAPSFYNFFILSVILLILSSSPVYAENYNDIQEYIDKIDREADLYLQKNSTYTKPRKSETIHLPTFQSPTKPSQLAKSSQSFPEISKQLNHWADAWSKGNLNQYIERYAKNYSPSNKTRKQWIKNRKQRIKPEKKIKIDISNISFKEIKNRKEIQSIFTQKYTSIHYSDVSKKQLTWKNTNNTWLITLEKTIR